MPCTCCFFRALMRAGLAFIRVPCGTPNILLSPSSPLCSPRNCQWATTLMTLLIDVFERAKTLFLTRHNDILSQKCGRISSSISHQNLNDSNHKSTCLGMHTARNVVFSLVLINFIINKNFRLTLKLLCIPN